MALFVLDTQILVIFDPTFELIVYRTSKIFTKHRNKFLSASSPPVLVCDIPV